MIFDIYFICVLGLASSVALLAKWLLDRRP